MKRHDNKRDFACSDCDYKSFTKIDLDRHYACIHSNAPDHICEYCGKTFFAKRLLTKHIKVVHSDTETHFTCAHVRQLFLEAIDSNANFTYLPTVSLRIQTKELSQSALAAEAPRRLLHPRVSSVRSQSNDEKCIYGAFTSPHGRKAVPVRPLLFFVCLQGQTECSQKEHPRTSAVRMHHLQ